MAFKLIESAQQRWRAVNAPHLVALVRAGARFEKGLLVLTVAHALVKVLQTSADDEKGSASCRIHPFPFDAWVSQG
jgi:hypothetical protein